MHIWKINVLLNFFCRHHAASTLIFFCWNLIDFASAIPKNCVRNLIELVPHSRTLVPFRTSSGSCWAFFAIFDDCQYLCFIFVGISRQKCITFFHFFDFLNFFEFMLFRNFEFFGSNFSAGGEWPLKYQFACVFWWVETNFDVLKWNQEG